jgi:hypothetical protein
MQVCVQTALRQLLLILCGGNKALTGLVPQPELLALPAVDIALREAPLQCAHSADLSRHADSPAARRRAAARRRPGLYQHGARRLSVGVKRGPAAHFDRAAAARYGRRAEGGAHYVTEAILAGERQLYDVYLPRSAS